MKLVLLLSLLVSAAGMACEISLAPQLIVLHAEPSARGIESKDCSDELRNDLVKLLSGIEGKVSSVQLAEMLAQKGHEKIFIRPYMLHVRQLRTMIREQLFMPS